MNLKESLEDCRKISDFITESGLIMTITTNICLQGGIPAWRICNAVLLRKHESARLAHTGDLV